MAEKARPLPAELAGRDGRLSPEAEALIRIAVKTPRTAAVLSRELPDLERAIVLLHAGDAGLQTCARDSEDLVQVITEARWSYEQVERMAQTKFPARWQIVEAAALYGLAILSMAEGNLWDAALQLRRAAGALSGFTDNDLIVEDLQIHGVDARRVYSVISELRADVLQRLEKQALTGNSLSPA
jgi:hypothetical protein